LPHGCHACWFAGYLLSIFAIIRSAIAMALAMADSTAPATDDRLSFRPWLYNERECRTHTEFGWIRSRTHCGRSACRDEGEPLLVVSTEPVALLECQRVPDC